LQMLVSQILDHWQSALVGYKDFTGSKGFYHLIDAFPFLLPDLSLRAPTFYFQRTFPESPLDRHLEEFFEEGPLHLVVDVRDNL